MDLAFNFALSDQLATIRPNKSCKLPTGARTHRILPNFPIYERIPQSAATLKSSRAVFAQEPLSPRLPPCMPKLQPQPEFGLVKQISRTPAVYKGLYDSEIAKAGTLRPARVRGAVIRLFPEAKIEVSRTMRKLTLRQIQSFVEGSKKNCGMQTDMADLSILRGASSVRRAICRQQQLSIENMSVVGDQSDLFHLSLIKWIRGIGTQRLDIVENLRRDVIRASYYLKNQRLIASDLQKQPLK
ncbi:hypothetical protein SS50377_22793 [Spironucleus salmonicida]|uniref:Uncharacterized protein n=1 Tax=Spironucleus salmonicida TaxID=348837 RepID=V6LNJ0_9EUKA|nr:hypothetical protein SS50377_28785 [Spironucleus salmonicida]KAH0575166.1 hypothetical protein SS50377_22793 [Spironucleus salmonicida]|eukprot:EST42304.1 Hypothetical protein SS50377_18173 [Spironucleus salmonicida]